jgi:RNA polymerase sigma factor (sigma-70 family)
MTAYRHNLILRAQTGDGDALDRLLAMCQVDARRYAMRHCAASEIDDAVQESLLIVVRRVHALRTAAAFAGWLFTVVRRECARMMRRLVSHEDIDDDRIAAELAAHSDEQLRLELVFALESLPAHYLEIIMLRDVEELTIAEICARLGVTVAVAKARLRRARLLMREYMLGEDAGAA